MRHAIDRAEKTTDKYFIVRLQQNGIERRQQSARYSRARVKALVKTAVSVEPRDSIAIGLIDRREPAGYQNFAIILQSHRINPRRVEYVSRADSGAWIEAAINAAIGIKAGNSIAALSVHSREPSSDKHFAVRLRQDTFDKIVRSI